MTDLHVSDDSEQLSFFEFFDLEKFSKFVLEKFSKFVIL
jgi:hypothetical protein